MGGDPVAFRDSLLAMLVATATSLVAGMTLAATTGTLEELPGLLLLVPAALAVKGNIFGALGSRLGTSIHAGSFRLTAAPDSVVGQNTVAAMALTLLMSVLLAVMAKGVAIAFDVSPTMSLADYVAISVFGGILASAIILVITLLLADASVRFGLDLDNVVAPLVTATGDLVSLPALVLATGLAGVAVVTPVLAWVVTVGAVITLIWSLRTRLTLFRSVVRESLPVLIVAGLFDLVAGITIEKRLDDFVAFPVLLVLLPGFLGAAGALGGILSSRLSTKLHLGLLHSGPLPRGPAVGDIVMVFVLSVPVFVATGGVAELGGALTDETSPGLLDVLAVALLGGVMVMVFVVVVAYYATIIAHRFGLDPDTYGIPMVTSSLDFVGAFALILAIVAVGLT